MFCAFAVNFLSAMWFAIRIYHLHRARFTKCVGFLTILIGVMISLRDQTIGIWISALPAPIFLAMIGYKNWHRRKNRDKQLRLLVDSIILEMRAGKSFRSATAKVACSLQDERLSELLKIWLASSQTQSSRGFDRSWWQTVQQELCAIDREAHQALSRMQQWRQRLKLQADFGRRFGQVVVQVRLQALVITVLYFAILLFNLFRGAWNHNSELIMVSFSLFVMGLGLIFRLGRKVKWTF